MQNSFQKIFKAPQESCVGQSRRIVEQWFSQEDGSAVEYILLDERRARVVQESFTG